MNAIRMLAFMIVPCMLIPGAQGALEDGPDCGQCSNPIDFPAIRYGLFLDHQPDDDEIAAYRKKVRSDLLEFLTCPGCDDEAVGCDRHEHTTPGLIEDTSVPLGEGRWAIYVIINGAEAWICCDTCIFPV